MFWSTSRWSRRIRFNNLPESCIIFEPPRNSSFRFNRFRCDIEKLLSGNHYCPIQFSSGSHLLFAVETGGSVGAHKPNSSSLMKLAISLISPVQGSNGHHCPVCRKYSNWYGPGREGTIRRCLARYRRSGSGLSVFGFHG